MIVKSFEAPVKKKPPNLLVLPHKQTQSSYPPMVGGKTEPRPTQADVNRAKQFGCSPEEFVRRDNIVRQLYLDNSFRAGELVRPVSDEVFETYGRFWIKQVYKSYHDFTTGEGTDWPADDKPFLIAAQPDKGEGKLLLCRADTLKRFFDK